eukprot:COSAG05_NODE_969_length_6392_cov_59.426506_7_plen_82_part_00
MKHGMLREIQREPLLVRTQSRATSGDGAYSTMRGGVKVGSGTRWRTRWKVCPCSDKRRWHRSMTGFLQGAVDLYTTFRPNS